MYRKLFFLVGLIGLLLFVNPVKAQEREIVSHALLSESNYILDTLNWLDESQKQKINAIASELDAEGLAQIYVATVDDCGSDKQQYRNQMFTEWNIGTQKRNGGLLILVCWYGGDETLRSVEVKTDAKMQKIVSDDVATAVTKNNFIPESNQSQYGAGLVKMVVSFDGVIRGKNPESASPYSTFQKVAVGIGGLLCGVPFLGLFVGGGFLFFLSPSTIKRNRVILKSPAVKIGIFIGIVLLFWWNVLIGFYITVGIAIIISGIMWGAVLSDTPTKNSSKDSDIEPPETVDPNDVSDLFSGNNGGGSSTRF